MDWKLANRVEIQYSRALTRLYNELLDKLKGEKDPLVIAEKLRKVSNNVAFNEYVLSYAVAMAANVGTATGKTWREAAKSVNRGSDIYNAIMKSLETQPGNYYSLIRENAKYIKAVPRDVSNWIVEHVQQEAMRGRRASDIVGDIHSHCPEMMENRAKLIARTETSKVQTAFTQARAEELGLNWYIWRTSEDSRVRKAHGHMNGVIINWGSPPNPEALSPTDGQKSYGNYHAGNTFNCRCYPEPIVSLDFVTWPAKVYYSGRIQTMTRREFEEIAA